MMTADGIEFEYPLIRRLNNKIRITWETEQNRNNSHIAEEFKSVDITRDRFPVRSSLFFSVLLRCFSIEFCQNFFCLRLEVPSRDLNGDGGNWSRWIRICDFYSPNIYPSKLLRGDMSDLLQFICFSYHRGTVLKEEFPAEKNSIFGFSVVNYPRRRWDLEREPLTVSQKKFWQNSMEKQRNRTEKNKPLRTGFETVSHYPRS